MILAEELIVDNFAGGGGASEAITEAIGRPPDIAINHDREALAMHNVNHPETLHLCENVWKVDILAVVKGRPVGLAWFSPDCRHFSKAKGGKPVKKEIRGLAWVALKWAGLVKPRIIVLENVEEFTTWGPVHADPVEGKRRVRCKHCRESLDGKPCKAREGVTFKRWVAQLRKLGYVVDWRELKAHQHGAPTIRKRLFIVARRDVAVIPWPKVTHGPGKRDYRTAAECIDWSLPCPSIFLTREEGRALGVNRPLADATMRRIGRGVWRYVIDTPKPFIVPRPFLVSLTHHGGDRTEDLREPFRTITGARRGEKALVVPTLIQTGYGERDGQAPRVPGLHKPIGTLVGSGKHALISAFLAQHNAGFNDGVGRSAEEPLSTVCLTGSHQSVVASHLVKLRGTCADGQRVDEPMPTVSAQGTHVAEVRAFLMKYYGADQDPRLEEPLHTVTSKHRFGLVTVHGEDYVIADIGMRMLAPRELFRAQGFPEKYIIDRGRDVYTGRWMKLTKTAQVRMCGNSVSPPPAVALLRVQMTRSRAGCEKVA